jgi:hypothetical protein
MEENQMITTTDFQLIIAVPSTPADAFDAVCRVSDWWVTDIEGETRGVGSAFIVRFGDPYVEFKNVEFAPGETASWLVTDCYLPWLEDKTEWTGTTVRFDISPTNDGSQVTLTHIGLVRELECYESCEQGWQQYFQNSLKNLIQEGTGAPQVR